MNQALQRIGGEFRFVRPKTDRSRRTIALPKSVVKALLAQRARQAADRLAIGPAWQDHGLVFTMQNGSPIERKFLHNDFKRVLTDATLPDCRFHDLRHSAASLLLAQGIPLREIMELLGHSSITLTADTYSHLMAPAMRAVADTMGLGSNRSGGSEIGLISIEWLSTWLSNGRFGESWIGRSRRKDLET